MAQAGLVVRCVMASGAALCLISAGSRVRSRGFCSASCSVRLYLSHCFNSSSPSFVWFSLVLLFYNGWDGGDMYCHDQGRCSFLLDCQVHFFSLDSRFLLVEPSRLFYFLSFSVLGCITSTFSLISVYISLKWKGVGITRTVDKPLVGAINDRRGRGVYTVYSHGLS